MRRLCFALQIGATATAVVACASMLGSNPTLSASILKDIVSKRTCAQANAIEVIAGTVPSLPGGPCVAREECSSAGASARCISCTEGGVEGESEEAIDSPGSEGTTDAKLNHSCGSMKVGTCSFAAGKWTCVAQGTQGYFCKQVTSFIRQTVPENPVNPGDPNPPVDP